MHGINGARRHCPELMAIEFEQDILSSDPKTRGNVRVSKKFNLAINATHTCRLQTDDIVKIFKHFNSHVKTKEQSDISDGRNR
jgi:hypothetical protein